MRKFHDNKALISSFGMIFLGLYIYGYALERNPIYGFILFFASSSAIIVIFFIWKRFSSNYAHKLIFWVTNHKLARKLVAGGSYSYYEYQENPYRIGLFEPLSRLLSLMIGFVGLSSVFAKILGITPESPVADLTSVIIWSILIFAIPIVLTPIIPIMWTMEDLQLKSWDSKNSTNVKVSLKYKTRFNSFIAVSTLSIAYSLNANPALGYVDNVTNFITLLIWSLIILTYPIALLTTLYYLYFRGKVNKKVREKLNIPIAETALLFRNSEGDIIDSDGNIVFKKASAEAGFYNKLAEMSTKPPKMEKQVQLDDTSEAIDSEKSLIEQSKSTIQTSAEKIRTKTKDFTNKILGGLGRKRKDGSKKKSKQRKGGSATEGLWNHDE